MTRWRIVYVSSRQPAGVRITTSSRAYAPNHNDLTDSPRRLVYTGLGRLSYRPPPGRLPVWRFPRPYPVGRSEAKPASQAKPTPSRTQARARRLLYRLPASYPVYPPVRALDTAETDRAPIVRPGAYAARRGRRSDGGRRLAADLGGGGGHRRRGEPAVPAGAACRICHLVPEGGVGPGRRWSGSECGCKDELGAAHRHCAEAWFRIRAIGIHRSIPKSFVPVPCARIAW